jgi:hypothetical protein
VRQDIEASDKRYSFNIPADDIESKFVIIAEAPIDIMSIATLRKMSGDTDGKYNYLSLGGTAAAALAQYLSDHQQIDCIILGLDNDSAGRKCAERIRDMIHTDETLKNRHISVISEPPPVGKDYNDVILAVIQQQKETTLKNRYNADIFI